MSRSGYSEACEYIGLWRANIRRATNGNRGQTFFRDLVAALDAMPVKRLVAGELETTDGEVCTLGALNRANGGDANEVDLAIRNQSFDYLGEAFGIAAPLAQEAMYVNDEAGPWKGETPEERWTRVRAWAARQIRVTAAEHTTDQPHE